jgi:triosephosphate isomerase
MLMNKHATPIIVGNWKTTPATLQDAVKFVKRLDAKCKGSKRKLPKKSYLLAVPDIFIPHLSEVSVYGHIGSQNVSGTALGQVTGVTVPSMLATGGASFTIIGHSEVRERGETKEERAKKIALSLQAELTTIVCVGEILRDKNGNYLAKIEEDVKSCLSLAARTLFKNLIICYEPVWAIGGTVAATPTECFEVIIAIRRSLSTLAGIEYAKKVKVLYGGTVTKENASAFLKDGGADGVLVGRASQDSSDFADIIISCHGK